ncbi:MAG: T9SS C-terminal target domain-containing protein, partial [Candidatus Zixiibacteriota bacterium]
GKDPADVLHDALPVQFDMAAYARNEFYPSTRVEMGEPVIMRGVRLAALRMNPVQYNPVTQELKVTTRFKVTVHFEGSDLRAVPARRVPLSPAWANLMRAQVLNFDELDLDQTAAGSYLVICENGATLLNELQPLVDWKRRKGHSVTVQTFTPGASNTTIKALIQTAYNTWPEPPEYVLLFGDISGEYALAGWLLGVDHTYAQLDGPDVFPDVALGRLPAENLTEAVTMVRKVLWYEKTPYVTSTDWYHQGLVVGYSPDVSLAATQAGQWIKTRMLENGFTQVDTLFYGMSGPAGFTITNAFNNGISLYNYSFYLGMWGFSMYNIDNLANGFRMPFCTLIGEATGGFSADSYIEHFVAAGTPTLPKGAVAAIGGATTGQSSRHCMILDMGLYAGMFQEDITVAAHIMNRGKMEFYNAYYPYDLAAVNNYFNWYCLSGDPGLEVFTGAIHFLECNVPDSALLGINALTLTVTEPGGGPVEGATVAAYRPGTPLYQSVGVTGANGQVVLPFDVPAAGNVKLTVWKHNYHPIVDSLNVVQADVAVGFYAYAVDDDTVGSSNGDGDGILNPGEQAELTLTLKNYGASVTATNVFAVSTSLDPLFQTTGYMVYPNLAPGDTAAGLNHDVLLVSGNCPDGHAGQIALINFAAQGSWAGSLYLPVMSWDLDLLEAQFQGADTLLSPGETANLVLYARNTGHKDASAVWAGLGLADPYVFVDQATAEFPNAPMGQGTNNAAHPFTLTALPTAPPGHVVTVYVEWHANLAMAVDSFTVTLAGAADGPQGPDAYGYYCFDNTDLNYAQCPAYEWMEIDPNNGGPGTILPIIDPGPTNDMSLNLPLPFTFRYYGEAVDIVTVCSNGWLSTRANPAFDDFMNWPIPSPAGPDGHICPFWDDLQTNPGVVCAWYDSAQARFILEWSHMKPYSLSTYRQTFQAILYDPAYWPTPTGDGDIVFQYHTVYNLAGSMSQVLYATVGIESPDHSTGLQVTYWNEYPPAAAPLQAGRAYKFTTAFDYTLPGAVNLTLTPYGAPVQIPATGGSFDFDVSIINAGQNATQFDAWIMQMTPAGVWQGPMLGPVDLTLPAGAGLLVTRTQNVPGTADPGTYEYAGYIGDYPYVRFDTSAFTYVKLTTGDGEWVNGWANGGESFEPYLTASEIPALPQTCALNAPHPNPFNPETVIGYRLSAPGRVTLRVYDTAGREVAVLVHGWKEAGSHEVTFDGSGLASGMYLVRMEAGDFTQTQKLVLLK